VAVKNDASSAVELYMGLYESGWLGSRVVSVPWLGPPLAALQYVMRTPGL